MDEKLEAAKKLFRVKEFRARPSLLTVLLNETDLGALRNFFIAIFLLIFLKTTIEDIVEHSNPFYHFWLIAWNFKSLPVTLLFVAILALSTLTIYYLLKSWSKKYVKTVIAADSALIIGLYVVYLIIFFYSAVRFIFKMDLNSACTFIVTCESTRIGMKVHSFFRETFPNAMQLKQRSASQGNGDKDDSENGYPTVSEYLYFLICPALNFRRKYPRNPICDWNAVYCYLLQIFVIIYFVNLVFMQMIYPRYHNLDYSTINLLDIIKLIFESIAPGAFCILLLFYGLLHCWLNMFSELLRYADRQFYLNWWSSKTMAEYYRTWNLVVHDWLYAYVYRDISTMIGGQKGLLVAQTMVFFLSSIFHEYWFGLALRMFYPVIFILYFVFGGIFFAVSQFIRNNQVWNVAMWTNLLIGTGMFVSFYSQEWYARQRCAKYFENGLIDMLLPRHWFCSELIPGTA